MNHGLFTSEAPPAWAQAEPVGHTMMNSKIHMHAATAATTDLTENDYCLTTFDDLYVVSYPSLTFTYFCRLNSGGTGTVFTTTDLCYLFGILKGTTATTIMLWHYYRVPLLGELRNYYAHNYDYHYY